LIYDIRMRERERAKRNSCDLYV